MVKRWAALGGAAVATASGFLVRAVTTPAVATPQRPIPSAPPALVGGGKYWRAAWTAPVPDVATVSLSDDGRNIAWADRAGCVRRVLGDSGKTLWRTAPIEGVNKVVASPDGTVAAFAALNPERNSVVFLDSKLGDARSRIFAGTGAVWSAAFGAKGAAYVGTGGMSVYEVTDPKTEKPPVRASGIPESVAMASAAPRLAFGTWSNGGVVSCTLSGKAYCWRRDETELDRRCRVAVSADGSRVLSLSTHGVKDAGAVVRMYDGKTGGVLWEANLPREAVEPTALMSASGEYVAMTYRRDWHDDRYGNDWRLAYFNAEGKRLFGDKGSALFRPRIAAVSADGSTLTVLSGTDTILTLDRRGNFLDKIRLPEDPRTGRPVWITETASSSDGRTLLLRRRDARLVLFRSGV